MADLITRFKKKLEGAAAQVWPGDDKTYSSVVNAPDPKPKQAPVPMPSQVTKPKQASVGRPQYNGDTVEHKTPRYNFLDGKAPKQSFGNKIADIFDANTESDQYRRITEGIPGMVENPGNLLTKTAGSTIKLGNTVAAGGRALYDLGGIGKESLFGDDKSYVDKIHETNQHLNETLRPDAGMFNQGTLFKGHREVRDLTPRQVAEKSAGGGLAVGSEVLPFGRGFSVATKGVALKTAIPKLAVESATYGGAGSAGQQLAEDGTIDPMQVAKDAAVSAVIAPAGFIAGRGAINAAKAAPKIAQGASDLNERMFTPENMRIPVEDRNVLSDYADYQMRRYQPDNAELSNLISTARTAGERVGLDVTSGSRSEINDRIAGFLEAVDNHRNSVSQGGYARLPFGERDPAPDLHPVQKSYINDYSEMLKSADADATGGQMIPDGEGGYKRTTEHTPFYRNRFAETGRAPTNEDYFNEARKQIEGGKAAYGAGDEYSALELPQQPPEALPIPQTPAVRHIVEDADANTAALQSADFDRIIQEDFGRAGATTQGIVEAHAQRAGVPFKQAQDDVWRVAEQSGFDIREGRPSKVSTPDNSPLTGLKEGADTEKADIDALNAATDELKLRQAKGLTGVKHAVPIKESKYQRVYMYLDKDGNEQMYVSQRRPDGEWADITGSHVPIKRPTDQREILRLMDDPDIQKEVDLASEDGMTRQYIWAEDKGGTSSGLKTDGRKDPVTPKTLAFDPAKHSVEGGYVRNKDTGEVLGNYVAVGPNGIQVQIGRQFVNLDIEPSKLSDGKGGLARLGKSEGGNNQFNQAERWVEAVAKDEKTREQLRNLVIYPTREAEANLKVEANALGEGIGSWRRALSATVPGNKRKDMLRDAVHVIEPDGEVARTAGREKAKLDAMAEFKQVYGDEAAAVLSDYEGWMRAAYDNLLERMNTVRRHNGLDEVPRREDYITHIQELNSDVSQIYQSLREGIFGDIDGAPTRGKLPGQIAGRTEEFKPVQKYNPYAKKREGDLKPSNPFDPLATYGGVTLHNIHLTKPAAIVRSLETALRASQEFVDNRPEGLKDVEADKWDQIAKRLGGDYSDSIEWLTEHSNLLSGKSSNWNRQMLRSEGGRKALKALNFLQRQTGRANILGNVSSVVAQSLNLPNTIGTNGIQATVKGLTRALGDAKMNKAWKGSNFLKERYTDGSVLRNKSTLEKVLKPFGIPLGVFEKAFVHLSWSSSYEKALAKGLKGDAAIRAADSTTSKIVAGRSIGDTAHVYNSTITNVPLQFTREVTESWKNLTKDQSVYGKALTLLSAAGLNAVLEETTGRAPLPDPVAATVETVRDFMGTDDDGREPESNTIAAKTGRAAQRVAETVVSGVPLASSVTNQLPQDMRRGIFGTDSDLGRYEGNLALLSPMQRLYQAGGDLFGGDIKSAGQNAIAALPVGSQARKSWQGADAMSEGQIQNKDGDTRAEIDNADPLKWAQAILFGKNAIPEVHDSYAAGSSKSQLSGPLGEQIRDFESKQKRLEKRFKDMFSPEDNALRAMSTPERDKLVAAGIIDKEKIDNLTRYELRKRKELGMKSGEEGQTTPGKVGDLDKDFKNFFNDRSFVYDKDLDNWRKKPAEGSAKAILERANGLAKDFDALPQTNEIAEKYANFVAKRKEEKWGPTKENTEKLKFLKDAYTTQLPAQHREWYGLSQGNLRSAVESGEVQQADLDELIAYDDHLREMGLSGEIGNDLRDDYGYKAWRASGSGGGSGKSNTPTLSGGYFDTSSTLSAFRKLLSSARF